MIDCTGKTIVAGFWNSHVHFTEAVWKNAASAPAAPLTAHMQDDADAVGFHHGVGPRRRPDVIRLPLRRRVNSGEVPGRTFFLAGSIFPKGRSSRLSAARSAASRSRHAGGSRKWRASYLEMGLDGIKLFTGVYMGDKPVVNMDVAIAKAAVDVAHAQGKPVFAHPQNKAGIEAVIAAGVDVMAHIVPGQPGYTPEQLARFKAQDIALTPTLSLFAKTVAPEIAARIVDYVVGQLKRFSDNGGAVLFGTDIGFTQHYDTTQEYELMRRALSERQVLAALTTNPAAYFKAAKKEVEKGFDADLVVLEGDPWPTSATSPKSPPRSARAGHLPEAVKGSALELREKQQDLQALNIQNHPAVGALDGDEVQRDGKAAILKARGDIGLIEFRAQDLLETGPIFQLGLCTMKSYGASRGAIHALRRLQ